MTREVNSPSRGRRAVRVLGRAAVSRLLLRSLLAAFCVLAPWNAAGYHLYGWALYLRSRGWQPGGLVENRGVILFCVVATVWAILFTYVCRKAWHGISWISAVMYAALLVTITTLILSFVDQDASAQFRTGLYAGLAQGSLFATLLFGLCRAEIDRRLSGVTNVTQIDPYDHHGHGA